MSDNSNVTIGFPNIANKDKAMACMLKSDLASIGIAFTSKVKHLPKLTVMHIPLDVRDIDDDSSVANNEKDAVKHCILQKNEELQDLCNAGHTLNVVYMKRFLNHCNIGIKVSPFIRNWILERGFVFVGNSCCPIVDRLFVKQCYHCQQIGYQSGYCPHKSEPPTCLYCMGQHRSANCPSKLDSVSHRCHNCSAHKLFSKSCNHTANSTDCPIIQTEIARLQKKIDHTSKNVM